MLDEEHQNLTEMAGGAYSSPYHFTRRLTRDAGEPPVAMRRRVMLERAAWQIRHGTSVTDAAFAAGYESVEGFGRAFAKAFGHPPSGLPAETSHWLPAPNGIHFHPPMSLWVHSKEQPMSPLTEQLVQHDLDDTRELLDLAKQLPDDDYRAARLPGHHVTSWDGAEESVVDRARAPDLHQGGVAGRDRGRGVPAERGDDPATLIERHDAVAPRWLGTVRDIERRGGWDDRLIDALCDPPESFVMSSVIAHVIDLRRPPPPARPAPDPRRRARGRRRRPDQLAAPPDEERTPDR